MVRITIGEVFFISFGHVGREEGEVGGGGGGRRGLGSMKNQKFNNHTISSRNTHQFSDSRLQL